MAQVKLLLKESIKNVGRVGDIVEVSPGYARNYLLPKDLAVQPTPNNVKKVEARRQEIERAERDRRDQQAKIIEHLKTVEVHLERRTNEQGHLFGSVTATDIAKHVSGMDHQLPKGSLGTEAVADLKARILVAKPKLLAFTSLAGGRRVAGAKAVHGKQTATIGETAIWILPSPSPAAQNAWNENVWRALAREVKRLKTQA